LGKRRLINLDKMRQSITYRMGLPVEQQQHRRGAKREQPVSLEASAGFRGGTRQLTGGSCSEERKWRKENGGKEGGNVNATVDLKAEGTNGGSTSWTE